MLKNLKKHQTLYFLISILSLIILVGGYLAFKKFTNKNKDIVKIPNEKSIEKVDEKLLNKEWVWQESILSESQIIKPRINTFKIKFSLDRTFTASTDCNTVSGSFNLNNSKINFSNLVTTQMYCPKSLEPNFTSELEQAETYKFSDKNQLIIELKNNAGLMIFN